MPKKSLSKNESFVILMKKSISKTLTMQQKSFLLQSDCKVDIICSTFISLSGLGITCYSMPHINTVWLLKALNSLVNYWQSLCLFQNGDNYLSMASIGREAFSALMYMSINSA